MVAGRDKWNEIVGEAKKTHKFVNVKLLHSSELPSKFTAYNRIKRAQASEAVEIEWNV